MKYFVIVKYNKDFKDYDAIEWTGYIKRNIFEDRNVVYYIYEDDNCNIEYYKNYIIDNHLIKYIEEISVDSSCEDTSINFDYFVGYHETYKTKPKKYRLCVTNTQNGKELSNELNNLLQKIFQCRNILIGCGKKDYFYDFDENSPIQIECREIK